MSAESPLISIAIPAFNEAMTIETLIGRLQNSLVGIRYEIIIVDDCSTDGTSDVIRKLNGGPIRAFCHSRNLGKGAALRTAFEQAAGEIVVIQDADLEYDPKDIPGLVQPILEGHADVVYGSRFRGQSQRVHMFWHQLANSLLTWFSNIMNNLNLSDMETGYKAFRKSVLDKIQIREKRFGVEPEITAKVARLKARVYEVPISYHGRDYAQGKKIGFRDAVRAAWCIVRYRIAD
jgi:glycosyltransferase involved in cell wall biosynthesis